MSQTQESAEDVVSFLLEKSGRAFVTDDFEAFRDCICLPYTVETFEGARVIQSVDGLRALFRSLRTYHSKSSVTDMARNVLEAVYKDEETIVGTFETRLLNGTHLTQAPYPVFIVARRDGDRWGAERMTFAIEDSPSHNAVLMSVGEKQNPLPLARQGTKP